MYVTYGTITHAYLYNLTIKMTLRTAPEGFDMAFSGEVFFCRFQNRSLIIIKYVFSREDDARARVSAVAHRSRSIGNAPLTFSQENHVYRHAMCTFRRLTMITVIVKTFLRTYIGTCTRNRKCNDDGNT